MPSNDTVSQALAGTFQAMEEPKYKRFFCKQPFVTAAVNPNGEVHLCCAAFLKESAGNLLENTFPEVWNSERAQALRKTIHDGTYSHCIDARCPFLQGDVQLPPKEYVDDPMLRDIIDNERTVLDTGPLELHAAYDLTCNLSCPYCRSDYIALKGDELVIAERIHERVVEGALGITGTFVVSSQGDPFASKFYSKILREFDAARFPGLRMRMTTNGTLFNAENWTAIAASHNALEHIHVSVNGASKRSFEANQRGASWERLLENLEFLSKECRDMGGGRKRTVILSFIVQHNNYREMPEFVRLVKRFGFDRAHFGMLFHADRTFTDAEFADHAVHWPHHREHQEFQRVMADPMLREPEVFIVGGLTDFLPEMRAKAGRAQGTALSAAEFWRPEGVDWLGWGDALGLGRWEAVSAPRLIQFSPPKEGRSDALEFTDFAKRLDLDDKQRDAALAIIINMRKAMAELLDSPSTNGGPSPAAVTADGVRTGKFPTMSSAVAEVFRLAGEMRPLGARATYYDRFVRIEIDARMAIYEALRPRQRRPFQELPILSLCDVNFGNEPVTEQLRVRVLNGLVEDGGTRAKITWGEFKRLLNLSPGAEPRARAAIIDFKARAAEIIAREPCDGTKSPLRRLAEAVMRQEPPEKVDAAAGEALRNARPQAGGPVYAQLLSELDGQARVALEDAVDPPYKHRVPWLPVSSLASIDVPGADPIATALGDVIRELTPAR